MSTYSNDKQLIEERKQAASSKLSLNAQTAIDDLGLTPTFGGGGSEVNTGTVQIVNNSSRSLTIGCAVFVGTPYGGSFHAQNRTYSSGDEIVLENVAFPGVIGLYDANVKFQETSSTTCVVTEETTLHVIYDEGGR